MQKVIIGCDLDDTIEKLLPAWLSYLYNKHNILVNVSDVKQWDITKYFPTLTANQVFEPLHDEDFWKTVEPMKDAQFYIKKLIDEGYDFYIVTSCPIACSDYKIRHVVMKHFPFINKHNVIVCHNKQLINCDILIDDGVHNIYGNYIGLLKTTAHNQDHKVVQGSKVQRVYCWKHIYETIHNIFPTTNKG